MSDFPKDTLMNWDDIQVTHRYIEPDECKVYQYRDGLEEYPDFIYDPKPCTCGLGSRPYVIDWRDDAVLLDDGDWVVQNDWGVCVYDDTNFRKYLEEIP